MPLSALDPGLHPGEPIALGWLALGAVLLLSVASLTHQGGRAFSAAIVYVGAGLAAAGAIEVLGVRWIDGFEEPDLMIRVTEVAVGIALFANGVRIDRELRRDRWRPVSRLILVAMPVTIAVVALLGGALLGLGTAAALALGACLAPTDPVLAGDVGETAPGEDEPEPEFAITGEASLNDGAAAPFLLLAVLLAEPGGHSWLAWGAVDLVARTLLGIAAGAAVGAVAGRHLPRARDEGRLTTAYDGIFTIGLAVLCYGAGEVVGGYAFLAAFAGGIAFRRVEAGRSTHGEVHEGALRVERLFELIVLLLVFSSVTVTGLGAPGPEGWLLVVLLVVVVRPAVAMASLLGTEPHPWRERLYVSWFGVRGLGTLFYAATFVASGVVPRDEAEVVWWTSVAGVLVSIVVHGVTSGPVGRRLREA